MKNLRSLSTVAASLLIITLFNACTDETADPGTPGSDRDKYVGSWLCKESVNGAQVAAFTVQIQKYGSQDSLKVYNFGNAGASDYAIWLVSGNSITVPAQAVAQINFDGYGFYSNSKLNLNYNSDGEATTAEYTSN